MPRKPTISPTKLTTYLACPVKYRWTYVDGRGKWYLRAKSYYSFGTSLHRALEAFQAAAETGVDVTASVLAAYEDNWIDAGFSSAEEMAEAYHEGKEMLERQTQDFVRRESAAKLLFVEKQLRLDMGRFDLVGRLDRVDEHDDGTLEIVDYKTGRESVAEEDVATDVAMGCYQLLLAGEYPGRPIKATIYALRSGLHASASMTASELDQFAKDVRLLGDEIVSTEHQEYAEFTPRAKPLCQGCDFVPLCRLHEDYG
ncbi:MAG TPA: PD-(D/E)XK nuclease family protein [Fimbriimonadaceae bacterium]|nr:PD-(D/E)XK nuclease family protein [Fimbriimonadaceae bacterium]